MQVLVPVHLEECYCGTFDDTSEVYWCINAVEIVQSTNECIMNVFDIYNSVHFALTIKCNGCGNYSIAPRPKTYILVCMLEL